MPRRLTFSQYLMGYAAPARPPFLYGYAAMWVHLAGAAAWLAAYPSQPLLPALGAAGLASLSLGLVAYGLASRSLGMVGNIMAYALVIAHLAHPAAWLSTLVVAGVTASLLSLYLLLLSEYAEYRAIVREIQAPLAVPSWLRATVTAAVLLLCAYGLFL